MLAHPFPYGREFFLGGLLVGFLLVSGCDQQEAFPVQRSPEASDATDSGRFVNSIGMEFRRIPAGAFQMGSVGGEADERPIHEVELEEPFFIGSGEVTQAQWETLMDRNPSHFRGRFRPVDSVSWDQAQEFIRRLNEKEGTDLYRLPTEAEWEYAARGESRTRFYFGDRRDSLSNHAWYSANSDERTHRTEQKAPNAFGLHDVYGNVWEWTRDAYDPTFYRRSPRVNPINTGAPNAPRVIRGAGWFAVSSMMRTANRGWARPDVQNSKLGFRLVREIPPDEQ
jgi:formylglycine-generating enzyme required for sulfatase activity